MKRSQLAAVLWLRWRLTRNQWRRGGGIGAVLAVLHGLFQVGLAVVGLLGGLAVGGLALHGEKPLAVTLTWLAVTAAFLLLWTVGTLMELQRSEIVDLPRLMHLPIPLGQAFAINYLTSLLGVTLAAFLPAMLGLSIGLAADRGPSMLLLVPLSLGLLFMVTAFTYLLQGWLAVWAQNPRRRRALVTAIALSVVLLFQLPNLANLVFNVGASHSHGRAPGEVTAAVAKAEASRGERLVTRFHLAEKALPPLWLAAGAGRLAEGDPRFALLGIAGFAALGAFALRRGYRSTLRFYSGSAGGGGSPPAAPAQASSGAAITAAASGKRRLVERRLPGVADPTAAVALATLRSLLRAPELLMSLGFTMLMILVVVVAGSGLLRSLHVQAGAEMGPLVVVGVMLMTNLAMAGLVNNQFGQDRDGFRALLLAPIARHRLLLGKNLAVLPFGVVPGAVVLVASALWVHLPPLAVVAAVLQMGTLLAMTSMLGNLLSILLPFRTQSAAMKATRPPAGILLALMGVQLGFPVLCVPVYAGPAAAALGHYAGWTHPVLVDFGVSLAMAASAAGAYAASLAPLGRLLQRRETLILARVTAAQE